MPDFNYASLVKSEKGWYIEFYQTNPITEEKERFRKRYRLNSIRSERQRERKASELIAEINQKLKHGWPYLNIPTKDISVIEGLELALNVKLKSDRYKTRSTFRSISNIFKLFLEESGLKPIPLAKFDKEKALRFLDWVDEHRKVAASTYNNYIQILRSMFTELCERKYINENPFSNIRAKKVVGKTRRPLSAYEVKVIIKKVSDEDPQLLLAIMLIFYTFIRPVELRRLRVQHLNLAQSVIEMPGSITKNKDASKVTIPDVFLDHLISCGISQRPKNHFIFGPGMSPGAKPCGHHTIRRRFMKIVKRLHKEGTLPQIDGIQLYSWKDTGAIDLMNSGIPIMEIMRQARHKDLGTTQRYLNELKHINEEIKKKARRLL